MAKEFNLANLVAQGKAPDLSLSARGIEQITAEILDLKKTAGDAILSIGSRLIEAKEILGHGEWLPWLTEQVEFSERTAQRFMRLANEWTNPTALSDLGASKALSLLAIPAAERDEFIETPHEVNGKEKLVIDMTSRELEQAIKAKKDAEEKAAGLQEALDIQKKLTEDKLAEAEEEVAKKDDEVARLQKELAELKSRPVEVAVMEVDEAAIQKAKAEAVAEMQAKLDKAKAAADKAKEKQQKAEAALQAANAKLESAAKTEKRESIAADEDLTAFRLMFERAQEDINKLHGMLLKVRTRNAVAAQKLGNALLALADQVRRAAE